MSHIVKGVSGPNFLIIGAMKAGTTSLYHYLEQHPEIYMSPVKEPHYFAFKDEPPTFHGPQDQRIIDTMVVSSEDAYRELFRGVQDEHAIGEASAMYLYYPRAARAIRQYQPEMKLIVLLRNPVERAYSSFVHLRRDGRELMEDFNEALDAEPRRIQEGWVPLWHYVTAGLYSEQLRAYYEVFPEEQIRVYLYDDLKKDAAAVCADIFRYLGVDPTYQPDTSARHNVSGIPRNRALHNFLSRSHPFKGVVKRILPYQIRKKWVAEMQQRNLQSAPSMPSEAKDRLRTIYVQDILKLESLVKLDLSRWMQG